MRDIESLEIDDTVASLPLLYTGISEEEKKTGKKYYKLYFRDKTGRIEGRIWNTAKFSMEYEEILSSEEPQIVEITGEIVEFRDRPQIKVSSISRPSNPSQYSISDFVESAPQEPQEYIKEIKYILSKYQGEISDEIRKIIGGLFGIKMDYYPSHDLIVTNREIFEKVKKSPAAVKNHHARVGGLLEHIYSMIDLADKLMKKYSLDLSVELIFAGIILHDIGKTEIYDSYLSANWNERQKMRGHISLAQERLDEIIQGEDIEIPQEKCDHLIHILLSHHGKKEWGSPKEPQTREAEFVHRLDMIDSRLDSL